MVPGTRSPEVKRPGYEAGHLHPTRAKIKNPWNYYTTSPLSSPSEFIDGVWMAPRAGLDDVELGNISPLRGIETKLVSSPARSLVKGKKRENH
jgi:hypothetical protein